MVKKFFFVSFVAYFISFPARSQAMDNTLTFRNITGDKYFRINYENDFFSASDRDYTQGILIEKVHPSFRAFPLMYLLWSPKKSERRYGLAIEHNAYTPNQIDRFDIQYGDRPYSGVLLFKTFLIANNFDRRLRTSTNFSIGIIGQGAGGEQMQRTIHHWINYTQPEGWHNQIQNDLALNYQINIEKEILRCRNYFLLSAYGSGRIGTLSDKISAGFSASLGNFKSAFLFSASERRVFQWYVYFHLSGNAIAYDATLQGGLFNHSSVYSISDKDISRLTLQNKFGLVLLFKRLYLEYYRTGTTAEFETGIFHRTGGLQVGFGF